MFDSQVQIGPEFFKKAKADYTNWRYAFVRELMQNSIDSGANVIKVSVGLIDNELSVTCSDNGSGMTETILRNKLFSLGSSGKDFKSSVGGFGRAKEILYFCHKSFQIHTNELLVEGIGGQFKITPTENIKGTTSRIFVDDASYNLSTFIDNFRSFIISSNYPGKFYLNGELITSRVVVSEMVKQLSFGKIYKTDLFKNFIVVRVSGMPMFQTPTTTDFGLVLELSGKSSDTLSSNRDGFNWSVYTEYQTFLNLLAQGSQGLIRKMSPTIIKYFGKNTCLVSKLKDMEEYLHQIIDEQVRSEALQIIAAAENDIHNLNIEQLENLSEQLDTREIIQKLNKDIIAIRNYTESSFQTEYDFVIENHLVKDVPEEYLPETFGEYATWLVNVWQNLITEILKMKDVEQSFYVGFVFCETTLAEQSSEDGINRYMINPFASNVENEYYFRKNIYKLISTACHEIVHSFGYTYHNESYLSEYENLIELCMENLDTLKGFVND